MFNSTHTLVGLAIARTGLDKWVPYAAATAVIASNLPDIDIVVAPAGTAAYIDLHRGITHALIGIPILALLLAAGMYPFSGKFWKTFSVAILVMATHPLLDYANSYGLRPLIPFDGTWYYGDILFIFDPWIDLALLAGILAGRLNSNARRLAAWASLGFVLVYIGARIELHSMAASKFESIVRNTPGVEKWAVLPTPLNPLAWQGMLETPAEAVSVTVHAIRGVIADENRYTRIERSSYSEIVTRAAATRDATSLLRFARFPVTRVERLRSGYRVTFLDFRFYTDWTRRSLACEVMLDESLHVVKESLSFAQYIN